MMRNIVASLPLLRAGAASLAMVLALHAVAPPSAVRAATLPAPGVAGPDGRLDVDRARARLRADLVLLERGGKEAYLDGLFARLDADEARVRAAIAAHVKRMGPERFLEQVRGIGSGTAAALAALPRPVQERQVVEAVTRLLVRSSRQTREQMSALTREQISAGLRELDAYLARSQARASGLVRRGRPEPTWAERFFGNTTVVKNFLITVTTLSAVGTSVGIAAVCCSTAPIVPVLGGLIGLVALLNTIPSAGPPHRYL
jgi:hypothetical protein